MLCNVVGCAQLMAIPVFILSLPFKILKIAFELLPIALQYAPLALLFIEAEDLDKLDIEQQLESIGCDDEAITLVRHEIDSNTVCLLVKIEKKESVDTQALSTCLQGVLEMSENARLFLASTDEIMHERDRLGHIAEALKQYDYRIGCEETVSLQPVIERYAKT